MTTKRTPSDARVTLKLKLREVHALIRKVESGLNRLIRESDVEQITQLPASANRLLLLSQRHVKLLARIRAPQSLIWPDLERVNRDLGKEYSHRCAEASAKVIACKEALSAGEARADDDPQKVADVAAFASAIHGLLTVGGLEPAQRLRDELMRKLAQAEAALPSECRSALKAQRNKLLRALRKRFPKDSYHQLAERAKADPEISGLGEPISGDVVDNALNGRPRRKKRQ